MRSAPTKNEQTLKERNSDTRQTIHNRQGTFERVPQSTVRAIIQVEYILNTFL